MKIDKAIKQESIYLLIGVVILSAIMEAVFLICGAFDYTVILGNILGGGIAVLNFFLMGITLQKSLTDTEIKTAENRMKMSQSFRFLMLIIVAVIGGALPCFNIVAVVIPFFFPRVVMTARGLKIKDSPKANTETSSESEKATTPSDKEGGDSK